MTKKVPYCDLAARLGDLTSTAKKVYKTHAYIAGYYESVLVGLIADLPAHKQNELMRNFQDRINDLQKYA